MFNKNKCAVFLKKIFLYLELLLSIAGYVPKHATKFRTMVMLSSLAFFTYITFYHPLNFKIALIYYSLGVFAYLSFIALVLRKGGYRNYFIKKWGEKKGYLIYEGLLGFLFFNSGAGIGYVASSTPTNILNFINPQILFLIVAVLFVFGLIIKLWAAKVTSIEIYYWKDMFLGRKISKFVVSGPYKYFSNPMYGIGQLQAYALAIYYGSIYGLIAAVLYQTLVFTFYFTVEKEFINRVYKKSSKNK